MLAVKTHLCGERLGVCVRHIHIPIISLRSANGEVEEVLKTRWAGKLRDSCELAKYLTRFLFRNG